MATDARKPPLLVGMEVERAHALAVAAGWQARVLTTAPVARAPAGPQRVIGQRTPAPGVLEMVVANTIRLGPPPSDCRPE